jgi:hypothetical protein
MKLKLALVALLLVGGMAHAQIPERKRIVSPRVTSPILKNRTEILAERQRIANRLLQPGDSLLIRVFAYVDEHGVTRQPEIKTPSGNPKADTAAMLLVRKMQWQPALNAPRGVMMKIPVKLVRK